MRFLTIVLLAGMLLVACGGGGDGGDSKVIAAPTQAPFPPPEGENADVVQFLRDYYLTYEDVFSGRSPPSRLLQMYARHCTENLRPGALDVLVVSMSTNRPAANATKVTQIDVVDVQVTPRPDPDFEFLTVSFPGERDLGFLVEGRWRSGEEFEALIKSKTPLPSERVTRDMLRLDGKLYISDCDFTRGMPRTPGR